MAATRLPPQAAAVAPDTNDPAAGGSLPPDDGSELPVAEPAPTERPKPKRKSHSERLYGKGKKEVKRGR
jgi:hypothetical protein